MQSTSFENELKLAQEQFNQTFGQNPICNLQTRTCAILSIVSMGRLCNKIAHASDPDSVREEIKKFNHTRKKLDNLFEQAQKQWKNKERS